MNLLLIIQIQQKNNLKISPNDELVDLYKYFNDIIQLHHMKILK